VRFWFEGASFYDTRWYDRDSEWYRKFLAARSEWEAAWEETRTAAPAGDSDAMAVLETVMMLDQIPRSMYPNSPRAYESDGRALAAARDAVKRGKDRELAPDMRVWLYMPFLHSECLEDQERCVEAMAELARGNAAAEPFHAAAVAHRAAVERFGRLPERNAVLGRLSTAEELAWLRHHPTA